jgi:ABC-type Fe3+/spermidine/putrescine transport system ATPase subunit
VLGPMILPAGAAVGQGVMTIRPEAIRIGADTINTLDARVMDRIYLGTQTRLKLRVGSTDLDAVLSPDLVEDISQGQTIQINLPPHSLWVMA